MIKNIVSYSILLFLFTQCHTDIYQVIEIKNTEATIREGIAVHPKTQDIYISNLNTNTLIQIQDNGKSFIPILDKKDHYELGLGLDIHENYLYAVGNGQSGTASKLYIKNLNTGIVNQVSFTLRDTLLLNDLAIDNNGNAFITDSKNHLIWLAENNENFTSSVFLESDQFYYPNGIAIHPSNSLLYLASSSHGIRVIDMANKQILNDDHETKNTGIDGMKYHKGYLYFIMRSRAKDTIITGLYRVKTFDEHPYLGTLEPILVESELMPDPTTLGISKDQLFILANSQLEYYDEELNTIKVGSKTENTRILKLNISDIE